MQNVYTNGALASIRIQERLDEAGNARLAAAAAAAGTAGHRVGPFSRIGRALGAALANQPVSDLDFLPRLADYPAA